MMGVKDPTNLGRVSLRENLADQIVNGATKTSRNNPAIMSSSGTLSAWSCASSTPQSATASRGRGMADITRRAGGTVAYGDASIMSDGSCSVLKVEFFTQSTARATIAVDATAACH